MAVFVIQENEGVQSGVEVEVPPPITGDTDAEILTRKATSHVAHGWTIELQTATQLNVFKTYDESDRGDHPGRVDRYFRIGL